MLNVSYFLWILIASSILRPSLQCMLYNILVLSTNIYVNCSMLVVYGDLIDMCMNSTVSICNKLAYRSVVLV